MKHEKTHDLDKFIRIALLSIISVWTFQLIFPLLGILAWGFILAVSLYPVFLWLNRRLHGHSTLAASILMLISLFLFIGAIVILTNNTISSLNDIITKMRAGESVIPAPPAAIASWPLIGKDVYRVWYLAYSNISAAMHQYSSYVINASAAMLGKMASKSVDVLVFGLAILLSGYLMINGSRIMIAIRKFAERIAPDHGTDLVKIMRETIYNVSRGVIGISFLQSSLFGLVLLYAGIPAAGLLAFAAFFICLLQVGLIFLIIPIAIWLFISSDIVHALIPFIMLLIVALLDTIMKPFVFSRGLQTPMMVIFIGVIGGIACYGFLGIFIGPVVLALFYDLLGHWLTSH